MSRPDARPRVHLVSLGCAKNQVDSESLLGALVQAGAAICEDPGEADVIVVNTCGFITTAKEESINTVLEAAQLKEDHPDTRLVVVGCLVERHLSELREEMPEVDAWAGVGDIPAMVRACGLAPHGTARLRYGLPHVGYLRVSEGCDNRCAYCAIPLIRGGFRSRPPGEILAEAEWLVADGAKEVVIIGQDTTSYGRDLPGAPDLPALMERVAERTGDAWLRLLYTHPAHFTDALVEAYRSIPSLCRYVDLPLQHLADPVLERMGRGVTQAQCLDLVAKLRQRLGNPALRTTMLVGFPGETEEDFEELLRLVEEIGFDHLGVFAYSLEQGTRAAQMPGQVPEAVKDERLDALMAAQCEVSLRRNAARVGEEVDLLVDRVDPDAPERLMARGRFQAPDVDGVTFLPRRASEPGRIVRATIADCEAYDLFAH